MCDQWKLSDNDHIEAKETRKSSVQLLPLYVSPILCAILTRQARVRRAYTDSKLVQPLLRAKLSPVMKKTAGDCRAAIASSALTIAAAAAATAAVVTAATVAITYLLSMSYA